MLKEPDDLLDAQCKGLTESSGSSIKGGEATVTAIDRESIKVGDGRVIKRSGPLHLDQGIAVTSHASQGKTVDQVVVSVPVAAFSQTNEAQFYVSMSGHATRCTFIQARK